MSSVVTKAASVTKVAEPVVTIVSAPKSKTVVAVSPVVGTPVITAPAAVKATVPAQVTPSAPGSDTTQPAATGKITKVKTSSPVTAQPSYVTYY
jgi:hypothetical protein